MILWISAIRRCSISSTGRPADTDTGLRGKAQYDKMTTRDVHEMVLKNGAVASKVKLWEFLECNPSCCECNVEPVMYCAPPIRIGILYIVDRWVSTSIGVTLCESCATVHR